MNEHLKAHKALARIAQLETCVLELREALRLCAHPAEGWPDVLVADAYENSRKLVPDADGEHPELRDEDEEDETARPYTESDNVTRKALEARIAALEAELQQAREALRLALTAFPDAIGSFEYAWDECSGEEQDFVKEVRAKVRAALRDAPGAGTGTET